jgi:hypothetical protein
MVKVVDFREQELFFHAERELIDHRLRELGIGEVLLGHEAELAPDSLLVVAVNRVYSNELADVHLDFSPRATTLELQHEVGIEARTDNTSVYAGFLVSRRLIPAGPYELVDAGMAMTAKQLLAIEDSISGLQRLRLSAAPRHITKDLRHCTPSGEY